MMIIMRGVRVTAGLAALAAGLVIVPFLGPILIG
jgi:hypothetical protein